MLLEVANGSHSVPHTRVVNVRSEAAPYENRAPKSHLCREISSNGFSMVFPENKELPQEVSYGPSLQ